MAKRRPRMTALPTIHTLLFLLISLGSTQAFGVSSSPSLGIRTRTCLAVAANLTAVPDTGRPPVALSVPTPGSGHTAILLNPNARSVTPRVIATARAVYGDAHVYVTETADGAAAAVAALARQNLRHDHGRDNNNNNNNTQDTLPNKYSLVIPVGGDGTLARIIDLWTHEILAQSPDVMTMEAAVAQLPAFAYLPLGTGNGLGSVVGNPVKAPRRLRYWRRGRRNTQQLTDTLERLRRVGQSLAQQPATAPSNNEKYYYDFDSEEWEWLTLPMMQVTSQPADEDATVSTALDPKTQSQNSDGKGDLCFFAGVGFDSLMLNDFKQIKAWSVQTGWFKGFLGSVAGYCVALVVRTLPQSLQGKHRIHVEVTTSTSSANKPTLWVDHSRGDVVRPVHGPTLFEGTTGIVAAGTSPFYGGGLRLFPFARMTVDQMHLRVGRIPPWQGVLQLPQIFSGTYRDKSTDHKNLGCLDFIGDDFEIEVRPIVSASRKSKNMHEEIDRDGEGYPLQHSGEAVGHVTCFRLRVVKEPIRFVCLKRKPLT